MPGWRIGFYAGNSRLVVALTWVKSYLDYGAFTPIQVAAIAELNGPQDWSWKAKLDRRHRANRSRWSQHRLWRHLSLLDDVKGFTAARITQAGCPDGTIASNYAALTRVSGAWKAFKDAVDSLPQGVVSDDPWGAAPQIA